MADEASYRTLYTTLSGCCKLRRLKARQYNRAMLTGKQIAFIGGGNMSEALIAGLLREKLMTPERVSVSDPHASRREVLSARFGVTTGADNGTVAQRADIIVLCVEPQILDEVLHELRPVMQAQPLVISVAAGYPLSRIQTYVKTATRLVRAMPNTPSTIGEGVTALSFVPGLTAEDHHIARSLFESVGKVVVVEERLMDAVTGLSGSGPAYVFAMIEALADGGVLMGLPRITSQLLAAQTMAGAARMVLEQAEHPAVLKDRVASPGGTTIAGLRRLEEGRLRATLMSAVEAATRRSQELGKAENPHL
jgi:pyrroline-5-carboxylate reductase